MPLGRGWPLLTNVLTFCRIRLPDLPDEVELRCPPDETNRRPELWRNEEMEATVELLHGSLHLPDCLAPCCEADRCLVDDALGRGGKGQSRLGRRERDPRARADDAEQVRAGKGSVREVECTGVAAEATVSVLFAATAVGFGSTRRRMIVSSDGSPTVPANATLPVSQLSFQLAVSVDVSRVSVASVVAGARPLPQSPAPPRPPRGPRPSP